MMGLDTSHGCWHGPYSQFHRWRYWLGKQVGVPIGFMSGFYGWEWDGDEDLLKHAGGFVEMGGNWSYYDTLAAMRNFGRPVPWEIMGSDPIAILLRHSDCDGRIKLADCLPIARRLYAIIRKLPNDFKVPVNEQTGLPLWTDWREGRGCYDGMVPATKRFIVGLLKAYKAKRDVTFR